VHFAMHIAEDDYDTAVERLRERSGQEIEEMSFEGAGRAAYIDDPDGNVVELWTWEVGKHLR
jgi:predicted enzyme related to lactoylglutathione lyase